MVTQFVNDLHLPLSQIRLESYRPPNGSDLDMVTRYFWDMELARALSPALHGVELALRNSINATLSNHYNSDMWFYNPGALEPGKLRQFASALDELSRRSAQPTAGRIVAELMFGFWISLLSRNYEQRLWQPNAFALMLSAFPHAGGQSIQSIRRHYNGLRTLRNRVAHYEAIWDRPTLAQDYADILTAIGWISLELHGSIQVLSDFDNVFDNGNGHLAVEQRLKNHLGIG